MKRVISFSITLILIITLLACAKAQNKINSLNRVLGISQNQNNQSGKVHLLLYFPDNKASYLVPEDRLVTIDESIEKTIVKEIVKGSSGRNITQWLLKNTKVINLLGKSNVLTINFSKEFVKSLSYTNTINIAIVYSIVNSLTELPGIKEILFKVEGKSIGSIGGIDFGKPLGRNRKMFNRDSKLKPNEVLQREMNLEKAGKWLDSYLLMSDDENNKNRKYYDAYIQEMLEMQYNGFLNVDFWVGSYKLDTTGKKARVEVNFNSNKGNEKTDQKKVTYFNTVKIEDVWMVDWLTGQ